MILIAIVLFGGLIILGFFLALAMIANQPLPPIENESTVAGDLPGQGRIPEQTSRWSTAPTPAWWHSEHEHLLQKKQNAPVGVDSSNDRRPSFIETHPKS